MPAYLRFRRALYEPGLAQRRKLHALLADNAHTAFGKAHGFEKICDYEEFARSVPLSDYDSIEPWIARIRDGEQRILTREPVTHLIPTSGSTRARKLIPFTAGLQSEFNAAIAPWLVDLARQHPGILGGPAYWAVTPVMRSREVETSRVPVGFDADTAYLGGAKRKLADAVMAVPPEVQHAESLDSFRYATLLHLLRCRELRLISVWHPSFLALLLDSLPDYWHRLLAEYMPDGRKEELRAADPCKPEALWSKLRVISCWGDAAAETAMADLRRRFPRVFVQSKGLLATEAFVTIPFGDLKPVAIGSHFFEFIDEEGRVHPVEELRERETYEVVVTTAGGFWRYRLGDVVQVTGFLEKTPALRFLGRSGNVSDLCGEKLSEGFVAGVIERITTTLNRPPGFVLLAPEQHGQAWCYTLFWEGEADLQLVRRLETGLRANPHYACCRDLRQLLPPRVFRIKSHGHETYLKREISNGLRLGDIKACHLSRRTNWSKHFEGNYMTSAGD